MNITKSTLFIFLSFITLGINAKETRLQCIVNGKEVTISSGQISTKPIQNVQADVLIEEAENGNRKITVRGSSEIKATVLNFSLNPEMTTEDKTDKKQFFISNIQKRDRDIDKEEVRIDRILSKLYVKTSTTFVENSYGTVTSYNGECTLIKNIPKF